MCNPLSVGVAVGTRQAARGQCPALVWEPALLFEAEARTAPVLIRWLFNNALSTACNKYNCHNDSLSSLAKLACILFTGLGSEIQWKWVQNCVCW